MDNKKVLSLFFSNSTPDLCAAALDSQQNNVSSLDLKTFGLSKKNTSMSSLASSRPELATPLTDSSFEPEEALANRTSTYTPPPCTHAYARVDVLFKPATTPPITPLKYGVLKKQANLKWLIEIERDHDHVSTRIPAGKYYFVKMLNQEIRLTEAQNDEPFLHVALAHYAEHVLYAGEIYFDTQYDCTIVEWNNAAPTYNDPDDFIQIKGREANEFILYSEPLIAETDIGYTL